jgi:micrococcal nuclease
MDDLNCVDCSKLEKFSLNSLCFDGKIVKVYDGDTITAVFKFHDKYYKWSCRLDGIDCPEMKSSDKEEKNRAIKARDFLHEKIFGKIVKLNCGNFDKYGRLLCEIFIDDVKVNDLMIKEGHAVSYDGGTKAKWDFENL